MGLYKPGLVRQNVTNCNPSRFGVSCQRRVLFHLFLPDLTERMENWEPHTLQLIPHAEHKSCPVPVTQSALPVPQPSAAFSSHPEECAGCIHCPMLPCTQHRQSHFFQLVKSLAVHPSCENQEMVSIFSPCRAGPGQLCPAGKTAVSELHLKAYPQLSPRKEGGIHRDFITPEPHAVLHLQGKM